MHQRVLDNPSATLKTQIYEFLDRIEEFEGGAELYIEAALIYQFYHDEAKAEAALATASSKLGFSYSLTGVLGRRTKFQSFDTTQLIVETSQEGQVRQDQSRSVPKQVEHQDDLLLEKPTLEKTDVSELSHEALCVLLAQAQHLQIFHAKDVVIQEKASAYVAKVLDKPNKWSIYTTALFQRSKLESGKSRLIERASLQIQALVDQISLEEPTFEERSEYFFSVALPSPWEMDATQGYMFASLGAFKTALQIFNRRELWDEAISCLVQLGDEKGAEERVAAEMERMPDNPKLWCILGDLKEDKTLYEKAWELSGQRFSRAQRSLGKVYFKSQQWAEAMSAFEKALALNPLFPKTWFLLGCASLQVNDNQKALQAFSRVVSLEDDNAEAWNNMAAIHVSLDRPKDALLALKEASKLDYQNWHIWDNYFQTAMKAGELLIAVNALRRVAEIQEASFDIRNYRWFLSLLSKAIQLLGYEDQEIQSVKRRLSSFGDEVLVKYFSGSHEFWLCQAEFHRLFAEAGPSKQALFKAYRAAKTTTAFTTEENAFASLVSILCELSDAVKSDAIEDELFQLELILNDVKSAVTLPPTSEPYIEFMKLFQS